MTTAVPTGTETVLLGCSVRLHDLSQDVSQQTQMHPLHPRVEVYPFESHANSLAAVAGKRFTLFAFPLKIVPGTGSPVRLVAAVPVD